MTSSMEVCSDAIPSYSNGHRLAHIEIFEARALAERMDMSAVTQCISTNIVLERRAHREIPFARGVWTDSHSRSLKHQGHLTGYRSLAYWL